MCSHNHFGNLTVEYTEVEDPLIRSCLGGVEAVPPSNEKGAFYLLPLALDTELICIIKSGLGA